MASKFVGVDLGNSGAVAIWNGKADSSPTIHLFPIKEDGELNAAELSRLLLATGDRRDLFVVFERVFKPLSLVRKQGAAQAVCDTLGIDCEATAVVTWKKRVLGENSNDKQISVNRAKELWPGIDLKRTPRSRTDWHDAAEASLLAYYGSLLNGDRI